jgi:uncharacterized protein (DUF1499 family)
MAVAAQMVSAPDNLGVQNGQLAPCPDTPNCVSTQSDDDMHGMEPIPFSGTTAEAQTKLLDVLRPMERMTIVAREQDYLHVVFRSRVFRFPDDVEFYFNAEEQVIHFRAAARLGQSDLGVNRQRMEDIRQAFESQEPAARVQAAHPAR